MVQERENYGHVHHVCLCLCFWFKFSLNIIYVDKPVLDSSLPILNRVTLVPKPGKEEGYPSQSPPWGAAAICRVTGNGSHPRSKWGLDNPTAWSEGVAAGGGGVPCRPQRRGGVEGDRRPRGEEGRNSPTARSGRAAARGGGVSPFAARKRRRVLPAGGRRFHSGSPGVGAAVVRLSVEECDSTSENRARKAGMTMRDAKYTPPQGWGGVYVMLVHPGLR
ncbi:uncharacterized protein LOC127633081 [Xyrauchen texanus]|uniref:uncharacterized protein LOC127633081 n=1 Tax=Xyrauchen texanus TaxID=154827 RepID=UPI002242B825|nr:uncharacterized protein LOC127633081 [Xyrauchen texanus]